jgi:hypothetical protein
MYVCMYVCMYVLHRQPARYTIVVVVNTVMQLILLVVFCESAHFVEAYQWWLFRDCCELCVWPIQFRYLQFTWRLQSPIFCYEGNIREFCQETADDSRTRSYIASGTAEAAGICRASRASRASVSTARKMSLHTTVKVNCEFHFLYIRRSLSSWVDVKIERSAYEYVYVLAILL